MDDLPAPAHGLDPLAVLRAREPTAAAALQVATAGPRVRPGA